MKDDYKDNHSNHHKKDKGNWHYNTTPFIIINQKISIRNVITILINDENRIKEWPAEEPTNKHACAVAAQTMRIRARATKESSRDMTDAVVSGFAVNDS